MDNIQAKKVVGGVFVRFRAPLHLISYKDNPEML
jgi:hypothetical protein